VKYKTLVFENNKATLYGPEIAAVAQRIVKF